MSVCVYMYIHFELRSITLMATKVHGILQSFVALTWVRATIESVHRVR